VFGKNIYTFFRVFYFALNIMLYTFAHMVTVKEYAALTGLSIPAIYKQIRENRVKFEKKYGKYLIKEPKQ
jgi:hypothetical protein